MTNGATHRAVMPLGDLDVWTFDATISDSITLRIGEVPAVGTDPAFGPRIRLRGPDGSFVGDTLNTATTSAGELDVRALVTGTYTVLISNSPLLGQIGPANYILTLARTAGPYTITPLDEGGPLTNGVAHPGVMPVGDLDVW